ncbi:MAG: hypothetical protein JSV80_07230 [Acidobacteriota bacterium]|nr:MAG: hypothetical protein JSV80_07230 [Acidobacteriota bacterium]
MATGISSGDKEKVSDLRRQAEQLRVSGDAAGARDVWEAILAIDPEDPVARARLGLAPASPPADDPPEPQPSESPREHVTQEIETPSEQVVTREIEVTL